MDRQAARVADIGDVIEHLQRVDEPAAGFLAARQLKSDKPAQAAFQIPLGALPMHAGLHRRMDDFRHFGPLVEEVGDALAFFAMLDHAQRQRLQTLQSQKSVERRHRRADVAQQRHARLDDIGDRAERLDRFGPNRAVIARIGRIERRLTLRMRSPVEIAAIDDQAADRIAMTTNILRRGINDDRRAVLERTASESAPRCCRRSSGTPKLRPISATSAIGNTVSFGLGSVSA